MRNLLGLLGFVVTACTGAAGEASEPPVIHVTSPARALVQDRAGMITVAGTVAPGAHGDAVDQVMVNGVAATLSGDGAFTAAIQIPQGVSLIETVARDAGGATASDTRAVEAGALRAVGTPIDRAVTVAMSADSFAEISAAAGPIVQGLDIGALLAPLQPMVHAGDEDGEDCLFGRIFVDDLTVSNAGVSLSPVAGGLAFRVELDGLAVASHVTYAFACLDGSDTLGITADKIVVAGTLAVAPDGMAGFTTQVANPDVQVTHLGFDSSGIPGDVIDLFDLDAAISAIAAKGAELAMNPLVNQALGALGGPQTLNVLGQELSLQVAPSQLAFDPSGATAAMDMTVAIAGGEASPGFVYTANGDPTVDPSTGPSTGFQLGIADDLINELLAEAQAAGMLDLTVPATGGSFDAAQLHMVLPPAISADAGDGQLHIVLGDIQTTYTDHGAPVARVAISATVDLSVVSSGGSTVALQLAPPQIHVDVLDDLPNLTGLDASDLSHSSVAVLGTQVAAIAQLLAAVPLPEIAGVTVTDLSVGADRGYVMVRGAL